MDITVGISWETNNTTFNDFIFGNKVCIINLLLKELLLLLLLFI